MSATSPLALAAGILLIGLGLTYPLATLVRLSRPASRRQASPQNLIVTVALNAALPLTAVLAGFWFLAPRARSSAAFLAILIGSAALSLAILVADRRLNRNG